MQLYTSSGPRYDSGHPQDPQKGDALARQRRDPLRGHQEGGRRARLCLLEAGGPDEVQEGQTSDERCTAMVLPLQPA